MADMTVKPFNADTPNYKVLNAIRHEATPEYQARIPKATQADIQETLQKLNNYTPAWNEFVAAIVNKIGLTIARNNNWTNPLAKFKRGMLEYGDTIEEIQTGLVEAYVYDADRDYGEKAIFGQERPEVQADYHAINRENFYKITVKRPLLQRAFFSESGLADFINKLMEAPTTSDNWDEYLLMRRLFVEYENNGGFFKVNIPVIPLDGEAQIEARQALRAIRAIGDKLPFLSRTYNAAHMPVSANADNLELFVTPDFKAALDVEGLAALFNTSYAEINNRITVIDEFGIPDVQAILTTSDFFVVADTFYDTQSIANPVGLHENFFLHHHQIISASRFVPAIAFTNGPGTVVTTADAPVTGMADIVITDSTGTVVTQLARGTSYEVTGAAITTPEGTLNTAVSFAVVGSESTRTYVTQTGILHVSYDETATSLIVRATSTEDNGFIKDTAALPVVGALVTLWPNSEVILDEDTDGLLEVTPKAPTFVSPDITVPNSDRVTYLDGATPVNGTVVTIAGASGVTKTITAAAKPGFEIKTGATASWTYTK